MRFYDDYGGYMKFEDLAIDLSELFREDNPDIEVSLRYGDYIRFASELEDYCFLRRTRRPKHFTLDYSGKLNTDARTHVFKVIKTLRRFFKTKNYNHVSKWVPSKTEEDWFEYGEEYLQDSINVDLILRNQHV